MAPRRVRIQGYDTIRVFIIVSSGKLRPAVQNYINQGQEAEIDSAHPLHTGLVRYLPDFDSFVAQISLLYSYTSFNCVHLSLLLRLCQDWVLDNPVEKPPLARNRFAGNDMLTLLDARFPSISSRHMLIQRPRLPLPGIEIFTIGSARNGIIGPKETSRAKLGEEKLSYVLE